jgi:hypothetical protein
MAFLAFSVFCSQHTVFWIITGTWIAIEDVVNTVIFFTPHSAGQAAKDPAIAGQSFAKGKKKNYLFIF